MTIAVLFWVLLFGCCGYAALYGGWEGRWFAALYVSQSVLVVAAARWDTNWSRTNWSSFEIDLGLLLGIGIMLVHTRRFWPLWVFGFHLITVSAHLAAVISQTVPVRAYFLLATMWAVPKMVIVVAGIMLDRRAGLPALGWRDAGPPPDDGQMANRARNRVAAIRRRDSEPGERVHRR